MLDKTVVSGPIMHMEPVIGHGVVWTAVVVDSVNGFLIFRSALSVLTKAILS